MVQTRKATTKVASLTARQREIARLIANRYSQKEIAGELGISETSVQRHVTAIKQRLKVNSLREIATFLRDRGGLEGWENPTVPKTDVVSAGLFWPSPTPDEPHALNDQGLGEMNVFPLPPAPEAPRIVPRLLDGKHRVLVRVALVVGMVAGAFAVIVLAVATIQSITEMVRGSPSEQALEQKRLR